MTVFKKVLSVRNPFLQSLALSLHPCPQNRLFAFVLRHPMKAVVRRRSQSVNGHRIATLEPSNDCGLKLCLGGFRFINANENFEFIRVFHLRFGCKSSLLRLWQSLTKAKKQSATLTGLRIP